MLFLMNSREKKSGSFFLPHLPKKIAFIDCFGNLVISMREAVALSGYILKLGGRVSVFSLLSQGAE